MSSEDAPELLAKSEELIAACERMIGMPVDALLEEPSEGEVVAVLSSVLEETDDGEEETDDGEEEGGDEKDDTSSSLGILRQMASEGSDSEVFGDGGSGEEENNFEDAFDADALNEDEDETDDAAYSHGLEEDEGATGSSPTTIAQPEGAGSFSFTTTFDKITGSAETAALNKSSLWSTETSTAGRDGDPGSASKGVAAKVVSSLSQHLELQASLEEGAHSPATEGAHEAGPSTSGHIRCVDVEAVSEGVEREVDSCKRHPKHFFILSCSGKPVYCSNGEEEALVGLMALITALVSVVQDQGDSIRHIVSGSNLILFIARGPFYLLAASSLGEPTIALVLQLELLYRQVILIVTTGVERIMLRNPAFDARDLLQGVGSTHGSLISRMRFDPAYLMGVVQPLPLPLAVRTEAEELIQDTVKESGAYYSLLMVGDHAVAMDRAKGQPQLEPQDVFLLANFVTSNPGYRYGPGEAFCPVCLPSFNPGAFLHAYIKFLRPESNLYIVLLAGSADAFHALSEARQKLEHSLNESGLIRSLVRSVARGVGGGGGVGLPLANSGRQDAEGKGSVSTSQSGQPGGTAGDAQRASSTMGTSTSGQLAGGGLVSDVDAAAAADFGVARVTVDSLPRPFGGSFGKVPLWHFMVKFPRMRQGLVSSFSEPFTSPAYREELVCAYTKLHGMVYDVPSGTRPNRMVWFANASMVMLASIDADLDLFLTFDPLTDKPTTIKTCDALRKHFMDKSVQADLLLLNL